MRSFSNYDEAKAAYGWTDHDPIAKATRKAFQMSKVIGKGTGSKICPHVCKCGSACYQGFHAIECVNPLCKHYVEKTLIAFQREYLKTERNKADDLLDVEDAPTQPNADAIHADAFKEYLDGWGLLLGVPKQAGEADETYRMRILKTLQKAGAKGDDARMMPVVMSIEPDEKESRAELEDEIRLCEQNGMDATVLREMLER